MTGLRAGWTRHSIPAHPGSADFANGIRPLSIEGVVRRETGQSGLEQAHGLAPLVRGETGGVEIELEVRQVGPHRTFPLGEVFDEVESSIDGDRIGNALDPDLAPLVAVDLVADVSVGLV